MGRQRSTLVTLRKPPNRKKPALSPTGRFLSHRKTPTRSFLLSSALTPKRGVPNKTELQSLKHMISGHASMRPRREAKFLGTELMQQKPLALAVIEIAKQGPTRDTPSNWLAKVNNIIRLKGIVVRDPSWPTTEDALGHQFSSIVPIVALSGVRLERHENDRPRTWSAYLESDAPPAAEKCRKCRKSDGPNPAQRCRFGKRRHFQGLRHYL